MALTKYREAHNIADTAIARIEQLHPFPWEQVKENLEHYPSASDVVWCQEESLNDGPWAFARSRLETNDLLTLSNIESLLALQF
ncbi:hypothetical protein VN97_g6979 [Penicillium thymicola]|uniref:2-oxoglutarate dehydrogenase E1 component/KDG C-terminal domain-containing protein n=1 Tax=Penicillium thymicola TaxID=293382 RepID=A0AAI9X789_PENTH|nr:hypothetical protein VN97_g6979 [Penicillium thymicola]